MVGCTSESHTITDNSSFTGLISLAVGASSSNAYNFSMPYSSLSYCNVTKNEIVSTTGLQISAQALQLLPSKTLCKDSSVVCSNFDLVSTALPELIQFKVKSTFNGG
jgi:hypothetical protein